MRIWQPTNDDHQTIKHSLVQNVITVKFKFVYVHALNQIAASAASGVAVNLIKCTEYWPMTQNQRAELLKVECRLMII